MYRHKQILFIVTIMSAVVPTALGQVRHFYTIDVDTDRLKIVNTLGNVTDVGSLGGADMQNPDLAWHQGRLYALDIDVVFEIQTTGGNAGLATGIITADLGPFQPNIAGEALASDGSDLYMSYGNFGTNISNLWGKIDLGSGLVTDVGGAEDFDGAGFDGTDFWAVDLFRQVDNLNNYVYRGYQAPTNTSSFHSAYPSGTPWDENDLVASLGNSVYYITSSTDMITEYSRTTGAFLNATSLSIQGNYRGLEIALVPEPTTTIALAVGFMAIRFHGRRRRSARMPELIAN